MENDSTGTVKSKVSKREQAKLDARAQLSKLLSGLGFNTEVNYEEPKVLKFQVFQFLLNSCDKTDRKPVLSELSKAVPFVASDLEDDFEKLEKEEEQKRVDKLKKQRQQEFEKNLEVLRANNGDFDHCIQIVEGLQGKGHKEIQAGLDELWLYMYTAENPLLEDEVTFLFEFIFSCLRYPVKVLNDEWLKAQYKFAQTEPYEDLPPIQTNVGHRKKIVARAIEVLKSFNSPPKKPILFSKGGVMVWIKDDGTLVPCSKAEIENVIDRNASFLKIEKKKGEVKISEARPPNDLAPSLLESANANNPPVPKLDTISTVPIFARDGTLLDTEGYHPNYNVLLRLGDLKDINPNMPIKDARALIDKDLLVDFPFDDDASKAHAYAMMLLPFIREMITTPTPLHMVEAPEKGTGKGLLCEVIHQIVMGKPLPVASLDDGDEDELRKRITSLLLQGTRLVMFDNVTTLKGNVLARLLTSLEWQDRVLGASVIADLENKTTWVTTGNNIDVIGDMIRRILPIRLDAKEEKPYERADFKHSPLGEWVRENRNSLISALISIIKNWIDKGCPKPTNLKPMGSYESHNLVIGGILENADIKGFLGNIDELHEVSDPEADEWKVVIEIWWNSKEERTITASDFLEFCKGPQLLLDLWGSKKALAAKQKIGHELKKRRGKVINGFIITEAPRCTISNSKQYQYSAK